MKNQTKSQSRYSVHKHHGPNQWNIKYYGFESDSEIESAITVFFGTYDYKTSSFDQINELIGRTLKVTISGRSGGWFVVHDELSESEFQLIDEHINSAMSSLPDFLRDERQSREDEKLVFEKQQQQLRESLLSNSEIQSALETLRRVSGSDFQLSVKGIKLS